MTWCNRLFFLRIVAAAALAVLPPVASNAAGPTELGTFTAWSAHLLVEDKNRICYLHSVPEKSSGDYTKRGDTYVQVTHRTNPRARNEVSVTAGYTFKKDSAPTLVIDGKKFTLFTQDDTAWTDEANPDDAVVAAMRAGRQMVVNGTSSRGTDTVDLYSLSGFTAAHNAINKACSGS